MLNERSKLFGVALAFPGHHALLLIASSSALGLSNPLAY
jgi:hypothetical protein